MGTIFGEHDPRHHQQMQTLLCRVHQIHVQCWLHHHDDLPPPRHPQHHHLRHPLHDDLHWFWTPSSHHPRCQCPPLLPHQHESLLPDSLLYLGFSQNRCSEKTFVQHELLEKKLFNSLSPSPNIFSIISFHFKLMIFFVSIWKEYLCIWLNEV